MSAAVKVGVLTRVEGGKEPKRHVLARLNIPKSTYYRWRQRAREGRLQDRPGGSRTAWNRLTPEEEAIVLEVAQEMPELSSRQLAAWITDHKGFSVSQSTVYRILGKEGLIKTPEMRLVAGKEYHRKTTGPHQMWATDASYFRVIGWGYYYLVTVMDDYSRFILAAPFHPQTNGKLERYHQTVKHDVNQVPYDFPSELDRAIRDFVDYYNHRRYHKALGNVTPVDVLEGRREQILQRRKEVQSRTINHRRQVNHTLREFVATSSPT